MPKGQSAVIGETSPGYLPHSKQPGIIVETLILPVLQHSILGPPAPPTHTVRKDRMSRMRELQPFEGKPGTELSNLSKQTFPLGIS